MNQDQPIGSYGDMRWKTMSEETKVSEKQAVRDAFEEQVRRMFAVFIDNLGQDSADADDACRKLKRGLVLARKAFELANDTISE